MNDESPSAVNRFLKGTGRTGILGIADQGVVSATNVITGIMLARLCSKGDYGLYVLAFSLIIMAININQSALIVPFIVQLPREPEGEERASLIGATTLLQLGLAALSGLGCIIFGLGAALAGHLPLAAALVAASAAVVGVLLREYVRRVLFAQLRVGRTLWPDGLASLFQFTALGLLAFTGRLSVVSALLAIGLAQTTGALCGWCLCLAGQAVLWGRSWRSTFATYWRMGKWLVATSFVGLPATQAYPWILGLVWGTEATALLGACMNLVNTSNPFALAIAAMLGPRMAHVYALEAATGLKRVTRRGILLIAGGLVAFAVTISLFSEPLLRLFYGQKYSGNGLIMAVLAMNIVLAGLAIPIGQALVTVGRANAQFWSSLIMLGVTASIGVGSVLMWKVHGAAVALIVGSALFFAANALFFRAAVARSAPPEGPNQPRE